MKFVSTRGNVQPIIAEQAILQGLAPDGGLYIPTEFPRLSEQGNLTGLSYSQLVAKVLKPFFTFISEEELAQAAKTAYARFTIDPPVKLVEGTDYRILELFHGPTLAFKDMALCLLPQLMRLAKQHLNTSENSLLLTATSGDTGVAAMSGFSDVEGFRVIVFYPLGGVSELQERQMLAQASKNTMAIGIDGNFDDAQRGVKAMLANPDFQQKLRSKGYVSASANSINLGRLLAQIVYYVYASLHTNGPVSFSVPAGNFGNVLAADWARRMGAPIDELLVATNENFVLDDFFKTGHYQANRNLVKTESPSMDILVSSNLERLLALQGPQDVTRAMKDLEESKHYHWKHALSGFSSGYIIQSEAAREIRRVWETHKILLDPHTAIASRLLYNQQSEGIVVATASPFKFPRFVLESLGERYSDNPFDDLRRLSELSGLEIPEALAGLETASVTHHLRSRAEAMKQAVWEVLDD